MLLPLLIFFKRLFEIAFYFVFQRFGLEEYHVRGEAFCELLHCLFVCDGRNGHAACVAVLKYDVSAEGVDDVAYHRRRYAEFHARVFA